MRTICFICLAVVVLATIGCGKRAGKPEPETTEITFEAAAESEPVQIEEGALTDRTQVVVADLNLDGLDDVALVETVSDKEENEVAIYMRQKEPDPETGGVMYRRAGAIHAYGRGRIVGLASRRRKNYTDLIVLLRDQQEQTQMLRFHNMGDRLVKVDDAPQTEMPPPQ